MDRRRILRTVFVIVLPLIVLALSIYIYIYIYVCMYVCMYSKNRIKRENANCGNKTLVYINKNKYFGLIKR